MNSQQQAAAAPVYLRRAIRRALHDAIGSAPGNRAAALRRARDELLRTLSQPNQLSGGLTTEELVLRSELAIEIDAAAAELLRELAGRT